MFSTFTSKSVVLATGAALFALVLAGCGSSSTMAGRTTSKTATSGTPMPSGSASYGPAASGPHNDADITFVTDMLPHHDQAVEMADMALGRDTNAQVKTLAAQIRGAQAPEISAMSGWLVGWGKTVPTGTDHGMDASGMSSMGAAGGDGMMSASEMTALDAAAGTQFAKTWLTDMVTHHKGAVAMAKTELSSGQSSEAQALASRIIASQSSEIDTMTKLLPTLG